MTITKTTQSGPRGTPPIRYNIRFWMANELLLHTRTENLDMLEQLFCLASDKIYKPEYGFIDVVIRDNIWRITKFI